MYVKKTNSQSHICINFEQYFPISSHKRILRP